MEAAAKAGALGATSRGTVSISITIPPHFQISAGTPIATHLHPGGLGEFCVETNGVRNYHVAVLNSASSSQQVLEAVHTLLPRHSGAICGSASTADEVDRIRASDSLARSGESASVTLLVIPD